VSASPLTHLFNEDLYSIPAIITIVINKPWENIAEEDKVLLTKILGSVKLGPQSVRMISRKSVTLDELSAIGANKILIFGSETPVKPYELVQAQGFSVISADELSRLDDAKKKSLWLALKNMFSS
jgi:hypothetical protein